MPRKMQSSGPVPYAVFAQSLLDWYNRWREQIPYLEQRQLHDYAIAEGMMGIHRSTWSKYKTGVALPTPVHCLAIAHTFGVPLDTVLAKAAHFEPTIYITLTQLARLVEADRDHDEDERDTILLWLRVALNPKSRWLDMKRVVRGKENPAWRYKRKADFFLVRPDDPYARAQDYAEEVRSWARDEERDIPLSRKSRENIPVIAS